MSASRLSRSSCLFLSDASGNAVALQLQLQLLLLLLLLLLLHSGPDNFKVKAKYVLHRLFCPTGAVQGHCACAIAPEFPPPFSGHAPRTIESTLRASRVFALA
jgi:hypothetical protein